MALDTGNNVWLFCSWGVPRRLVSSLLDCTSAFSTPRQAECGWVFSAVLTQEGGIYVFWPFSAQMATLLTPWSAQVVGAGPPRANEGVLHCIPMDFSLEPLRLPDLPLLPELDEEANSRNEPTRVVSIAGLDNSLVALTNKGHVLKFDDLGDIDSASSGRWTYVGLLKNVLNTVFSRLSAAQFQRTRKSEATSGFRFQRRL